MPTEKRGSVTLIVSNANPVKSMGTGTASAAGTTATSITTATSSGKKRKNVHGGGGAGEGADGRNSKLPKTMLGDPVKTSCVRCRRRKIKCVREPTKSQCLECIKVKEECIAGPGEKQRPVSKQYVAALENEVDSCFKILQKIRDADSLETKNKIIDDTLKVFLRDGVNKVIDMTAAKVISADDQVTMAQSKAREGRISQLADGNRVFYGATSLFAQDAMLVGDQVSNQVPTPRSLPAEPQGGLPYHPHSDISRKMVTEFFIRSYPFHMYIYREFFLRDYDQEGGKYYSLALLYAICAVGAQVSDDADGPAVAQAYATEALSLLYHQISTPSIPFIQAALLLAHYEIGMGRTHIGWNLSRLAFGTAQAMGLHLNPQNLSNSYEHSHDSAIETQVLQRIFWGVFTADAQLSLMFGRSPAFNNQECDVSLPANLPCPENWSMLQRKYIGDLNAMDDEAAKNLIGTFLFKTSLAEITHTVISEVFESRKPKADPMVSVIKARHAHSDLGRWMASVPGRIHWNQWIVNTVAREVANMHMAFHALMIILHRPGRNMMNKPGKEWEQEFDMCYSSLRHIITLIKSQSKSHGFKAAPLEFVHTVGTAIGMHLMRRRLLELKWDDSEWSRDLSLLIDTAEKLKETWPCAAGLLDIVQAERTGTHDVLSQVMSGLAGDDLGFGFGGQQQPQQEQTIGQTMPGLSQAVSAASSFPRAPNNSALGTLNNMGCVFEDFPLMSQIPFLQDSSSLDELQSAFDSIQNMPSMQTQHSKMPNMPQQSSHAFTVSPRNFEASYHQLQPSRDVLPVPVPDETLNPAAISQVGALPLGTRASRTRSQGQTAAVAVAAVAAAASFLNDMGDAVIHSGGQVPTPAPESGISGVGDVVDGGGGGGGMALDIFGTHFPLMDVGVEFGFLEPSDSHYVYNV